MSEIKPKTELLSREYSYLQGRYNLYAKEYKSLYLYSGTYLTLLVGFAGYLITHPSFLPEGYIQGVLVLSYCYVYSGAANLFDSLQQVFLIEGRMSAIEHLINDDQGESIYSFQSITMPRELSVVNWHLGKWIINPAHIWAVWNGFFLIVLSFIHDAFFAHFCSQPLLTWSFIIANGLITVLLAYNWFWLNSLNEGRAEKIMRDSIIKSYSIKK